MIELRGVEKTYIRGAEQVHALKGITLSIARGEFVSVMGPSGSGKTTMLHILGCLDNITSGEITIDGMSASSLQEPQLVEIRRKKIGFVFQQFYLIPGLSVFDNVSLPLLFAHEKKNHAYIQSLIELVGLNHAAKRKPHQLSGGEMQRVAIARALVNNPKLILADEPTGNLDSENSDMIYALFADLHKRGLTIIMVTHNSELAARAERVVRLKDGLIVRD
ncbi:MAG: putative ABC transport system ATP-binding protein [Nitrospirae bacterium]|nr:MAG: putative ABC transport system ATP-binding protein [Nitrospirota bacterium]